MTKAGKHHNSALCHAATSLLTRIAACWRRGELYTLRDADGKVVDSVHARAVIADKYTVTAELRAARRITHSPQLARHRTGRRSKESLSAPSTGPSDAHAMPRQSA